MSRKQNIVRKQVVWLEEKMLHKVAHKMILISQRRHSQIPLGKGSGQDKMDGMFAKLGGRRGC
jgi:hypothetical protein